MGAEKAVYLMARMTVKGVTHGNSFGGIPELTKTDIAAACTRLQSLQFHLVMAKYCDDVHSAIAALSELQTEMKIRSQVWRDMQPRRREICAAAIVDEFVASKRCRSCKGRGQVTEIAKIVTCKPCDGTGKRSISATSRAKASNIPESTFRSQGLNGLFDELSRYLVDLEIMALERISRKAS